MQKVSMIMVSVIVAGLVVVGSVGWWQYSQVAHELAQAKMSSTDASKDEVRKLVEEVGKLIELPKEDPTVAVVSDATKLKDQPFFTSAQNGDRVLLFTIAKKAILYRPSTNKIIDVAPLVTGATPAPAQQSVVLRNGTTTVGLTNKYEALLKTKAPEISVIDKNTAARKDYTKTLLAVLSPTKSVQGEELAQKLGISVVQFPKDEATASADFLIIVGADQK